ncbi:putative transposase (plasmid) [Mycobacterium ulcerans Agy99]|uniref:Putative transposase n=1 Tax=Mycobacterium ulcerans (strain Agy99) TaxID=362242 RepID=Q6MZ69_MYCUA|nr:hypothetical protein A3649_24025 [Mycobacterium ulcerans]CAE46844.1 putative transposase [Mycobacterium ulcerans Agy99]CAE46852.1 putative transposase [Mycobacterium ulcerans Agy99]
MVLMVSVVPLADPGVCWGRSWRIIVTLVCIGDLEGLGRGQRVGKLHRRRPRPGDKWHLAEVLVKVNGITRCLWRAIDQDGNVSDVLVRSRRNAKRHLLSAIDSRTEMADRFAVGYEVTVLDAAA